MSPRSTALAILCTVVVALLAGILGFWTSWRAMAKLRAPAGVDGALLWWDEQPMPAFRRDAVVASFLAVHTAAIVAMGVLTLLFGIRARQAPPEWLLIRPRRRGSGPAGALAPGWQRCSARGSCTPISKGGTARSGRLGAVERMVA